MSTGGEWDNQSETQTTAGGNVVNKAPDNNTLFQPPNVLGRAGQPDNQDTDRPKGST